MKMLLSLLLMLFGVSVSAEKMSVFTKGDETLKIAKPEYQHHNKWVGKVELVGKMVLDFDRNGMREVIPAAGQAVFEPDSESIKKLPYAIGNFHPLKIKKIYLDKPPKELLSQIYDAGKTNQIIKGKKERYEIDSILTITTFESSLECDHRYYHAKVSSIRLKSSDTPLLAKNGLQNVGC